MIQQQYSIVDLGHGKDIAAQRNCKNGYITRSLHSTLRRAGTAIDQSVLRSPVEDGAPCSRFDDEIWKATYT